MLVLSQAVAADKALKIGLVTRVLPAEDLAAEVAWLARELGGGTERAIGGNRVLLLSILSETLASHLEREARMIAALSAAPQSKATVAALLSRNAARHPESSRTGTQPRSFCLTPGSNIHR